jgi:hypothetical protein
VAGETGSTAGVGPEPGAGTDPTPPGEVAAGNGEATTPGNVPSSAGTRAVPGLSEPKPREAAGPPLTEEELLELGRSLTRARNALGAQDFDRAFRELASAERMARLPEHRAKVARLQQLADYTQQFWAAFRDGLRSLKSGLELVIDRDMLSVVEVSPERIVLRGYGRNKSFPMSDLPDKLVMAVADQWFDQTKTSTRVFKGAYYATGPNADPAQARQLWEAARRAGADIHDLPAVLDDRYDLTPDLDR